MDRNLDGFYLRVKDGDKFVNKCFTDLTEEQQTKWLNELSKEGVSRICLELARIIKTIGDEFDIVCE